MNILLVYAHPESQSFNAALKELAMTSLAAQGHRVQVSDLYAMDWNAVANEDDILTTSQPAADSLAAGAVLQAVANRALAPDIIAEQQKLLWADAIVFQFPLWWFGMPAVMKGWFDRVFARGFAFDAEHRYDKGLLKGRRVMLAVTTGGTASSFTPTGINGDIETVLYPINHSLRYVGLDVLPPLVLFSVAAVDDAQRLEYMEAYQDRLLNIEDIEPIRFPGLAEYDRSFRLKPFSQRLIHVA